MGSACAVAFNNEVLYDSGAAGYCVVKGHVGSPPTRTHLRCFTGFYRTACFFTIYTCTTKLNLHARRLLSIMWLAFASIVFETESCQKKAQTRHKHTQNVPLCNTLQIHHNLQHPSAAAFTAHPSIQSNYVIYVHSTHPWHPSIRPWHPCKCPSISKEQEFHELQP